MQIGELGDRKSTSVVQGQSSGSRSGGRSAPEAEAICTFAHNVLHFLTYARFFQVKGGGRVIFLYRLRFLNAICSSNCNQLLSLRIISSGSKKGSVVRTYFILFVIIVDRWVSQGFTANLCAIDLSKAFDKINHHALFINL